MKRKVQKEKRGLSRVVVPGDRSIYINMKRKVSEKVVLAEQQFLVTDSSTSKQEEKGFRKSGLNEAVVLSDGFIYIKMKRKVPEKVVSTEWWFLVTGSFSSTQRERLQKKWS